MKLSKLKFIFQNISATHKQCETEQIDQKSRTTLLNQLAFSVLKLRFLNQ